MKVGAIVQKSSEWAKQRGKKGRENRKPERKGAGKASTFCLLVSGVGQVRTWPQLFARYVVM